MESNVNYSPENIIVDMQVVIDGCYHYLNISNSYSSWKNTAIGLNNIKHIEREFIQGVKLWIQITQNNIIGIIDIDDLKMLVPTVPWIHNFIKIIDYIQNKEI